MRNRRSSLPLWTAVAVFGVVTVALSLLLPMTVLTIATVPSGSMQKTLPIGSTIIIDHRGTHGVHDGSLVAIRADDILPGHRSKIVKRVIASAGETISCCSSSGAVVVNGQPIREPYLFENDREPFCAAGPGADRCPPGAAPIRVPPGRFFAMGDHRGASADSRTRISDAQHGTYAESDLVGLVHGPYTHAGAFARIRLLASAAALILAAITAVALTLIGRRHNAGEPQVSSG